MKGAILELFRQLTTDYATGGIRLELKLGVRSIIAVGPDGERLTALLPLSLSDVEGVVRGRAVVYGAPNAPSDYRQTLLAQLRDWHDMLGGEARLVCMTAPGMASLRPVRSAPDMTFFVVCRMTSSFNTAAYGGLRSHDYRFAGYLHRRSEGG